MADHEALAAQQRLDEIEAFRRELARLEQEGVLALSPDQAEALAAHHRRLADSLARSFDVDRDLHQKQLSRGMRAASLFGALALSASLFFGVRQFWGLLDTPIQVALLIGASLGTLALTGWLQRRGAPAYYVKLAAMVALTAFVLNVGLVGDIFNLAPSKEALLVYAVYALLLACACDRRLLLVAGIVCGVAYLSARMGAGSGLYWLSVGERPERFFPVALLLYLVPRYVDQSSHAGFAETYRVAALLTLFLPMLVLAHWGESSYLEVDPDFVRGAYQVLGFVASAAGVGLGLRQGRPEVTNTSMVLFAIFLYTKFFDWWWESMPKYLFFLVVGLTAVLLLVVLMRLRRVARAKGSE